MTDAGASSQQQAGVSEEDEVKWRQETSAFVAQLATRLRLPQRAVATAQTLFQRAYANLSFSVWDRWEMASACVLLASKADECPRKTGDIVEAFYELRYRIKALEPESEQYQKLRDGVFHFEAFLLDATEYTFTFDHPYDFLVACVRRCFGKRCLEDSIKELTKVAWQFVHFSLRTNLCLLHRPQDIAVVALHMASTLQKIDVPHAHRQAWFQPLTDLRLDKICELARIILEAADADSKIATDLKRLFPWIMHFYPEEFKGVFAWLC